MRWERFINQFSYEKINSGNEKNMNLANFIEISMKKK